MKIELQPYERRTLEALETQFALERRLTIDLALSLNSITTLFQQVALQSDGQIKEGRIVVIGLINHAHLLIIGGLQAIAAGNATVWSACVRGLIETFGAAVMILENPNKAPTFLEHVSAGKLGAAAERAEPGLKNDIDRLNKIVHPVSGAIYAGISVVEGKERFAIFRLGPHVPSSDDGREGITVIANLASMIVSRFSELVSHTAVLAAGKLIMVRMPRDA